MSYLIVQHSDSTWSIGYLLTGNQGFLKKVANVSSKDEALNLFVSRGYSLDQIVNLKHY